MQYESLYRADAFDEDELFDHADTGMPNETLLGQGDEGDPVTLGELMDNVRASGRSDVYEVFFLESTTLNGKARNTGPKHWSDGEHIKRSFPMHAGESYDLRVGKGYIAYRDFLIQDVPRNTPITVEAQGTDDQDSSDDHIQELKHDFGVRDDDKKRRPQKRGSGPDAQDSDKYEYDVSKRRGDKEGRPQRRRRRRRPDNQRRSSVERRECTLGDILAEVRGSENNFITIKFAEVQQIRSSIDCLNSFLLNRTYTFHVSDDYVSCDGYRYYNAELSRSLGAMVTVESVSV
jgi:hypothetical protein